MNYKIRKKLNNGDFEFVNTSYNIPINYVYID